jgi:hypothetical protein
MPDFLTILSDGVLEAVGARLASAPDWMPEILGTHMPWLGDMEVDVMTGILERNRYTGELQSSVISQYDPLTQEVKIFPTAMRGEWDAGALLMDGTRPIRNAPFGPIKAWAESHGLPAYPVWWKIRTVGVAAHPFLMDTLNNGQTTGNMNEAAQRIVADMAIEIAATSGAAALMGVGNMT